MENACCGKLVTSQDTVLYSTLHNHEPRNRKFSYSSFISHNTNSGIMPIMNSRNVETADVSMPIEDDYESGKKHTTWKDEQAIYARISSDERIIKNNDLKKAAGGEYFCPYCEERNKAPIHFKGHLKTCSFTKLPEVRKI